MYDDTKVKIVPIEEMEGMQFGVKYFADETALYVSPSVLEKLKTGEIKDLQFVMLSYPKMDRIIEDDMRDLADKFKSEPTGNTPTFDIEQYQKDYDKQWITGKPRILVSPNLKEFSV